METLVTIIDKKAAAKGISQKALVASAGLRLTLVDVERVSADPARTPPAAGKADTASASITPLPFKQKYRRLVCSNPDAPAEVFVRQALLKPDFSVLLDAATEFGLAFVDEQWAVLVAEGSKEAVRALAATARTLRNIRYGYKQANGQANGRMKA